MQQINTYNNIPYSEEKNNNYLVHKCKIFNHVHYSIFRKSDMSYIDIANEYLQYLDKIGKSPNTIEVKAYSLKFFMIFLDTKEIDLVEIPKMKMNEQRIFFIEYRNWLKNGTNLNSNIVSKRKNNTCNAYLKNVFGFYTYLALEEKCIQLKVLEDKIIYVTDSIGINHKKATKGFTGMLKEEKSRLKLIDQEDFWVILKATTNLRDKLLLCILFETGFRIGQALGIKIEDIDLEKGIINGKFRKDNENEARSKEEKDYVGYLSEYTKELIQEYLKTYKNILKRKGYLFVNISRGKVGDPMTRNNVNKLFNNITKKTKIKVHPHSIRHLFADELYKSGADILTISKALNHNKIETTERYLHLDEEQIKKAVNTIHESMVQLVDFRELV